MEGCGASVETEADGMVGRASVVDDGARRIAMRYWPEYMRVMLGSAPDLYDGKTWSDKDIKDLTMQLSVMADALVQAHAERLSQQTK